MREPDCVEQRAEQVLLGACAGLGVGIAVSAERALPNYVPLLVFGAVLSLSAVVLVLAKQPEGPILPIFSAGASLACMAIVELTFPGLMTLSAAMSLVVLLITVLGGLLAALPLVRRDLRRGIVLLMVVLLQWRLFAHIPSGTPVVLVAVALVTVLLAALCNLLFRLHSQQYRAEIVNRKLARATAELLDMRHRHSLSVLSAGIAHEVNNPINYLLGNLEYLRRYFAGLYDAVPAPSPETVAIHDDGLSILDAFDDGLQAVKGVVSRLRSLFRGDSDGKETADISAVISSVVSSHKSRIEPRAQISVTIDSSVSEVAFHPADLYVVVSNLVRNAEESFGADEEFCWISLSVTHGHSGVELMIEDGGAGIPDEVRGRVFDPFFTTKADRGGLGVGLTLCSTLAEKNGASLQLERRKPTGTRVTITFSR